MGYQPVEVGEEYFRRFVIETINLYYLFQFFNLLNLNFYFNITQGCHEGQIGISTDRGWAGGNDEVRHGGALADGQLLGERCRRHLLLIHDLHPPLRVLPGHDFTHGGGRGPKEGLRYVVRSAVDG